MENIYILASNNKDKLQEMKTKLNPLGIEIISQSEAGYNIEVEETGTTFSENATIKARAIYELSHKPVIADDSGLEVDFLNGEPGVYSARYAGPNANNNDRMNKILNLMKDAKDNERTARFKCAICYIDAKGETHIFEGACEGVIAKEQCGEDGFGYDPIFLYNGVSFANMTREEKNKISHRGIALNKFMKFIQEESNN